MKDGGLWEEEKSHLSPTVAPTLLPGESFQDVWGGETKPEPSELELKTWSWEFKETQACRVYSIE
jgi:hypothetical protein